MTELKNGVSHVKIKANVLCVYVFNYMNTKLRHRKKQIFLNVSTNYAYNHSAHVFILSVACTSTVEWSHKNSVPNPSAEMLLGSSSGIMYRS